MRLGEHLYGTQIYSVAIDSHDQELAGLIAVANIHTLERRSDRRCRREDLHRLDPPDGTCSPLIHDCRSYRLSAACRRVSIPR